MLEDLDEWSKQSSISSNVVYVNRFKQIRDKNLKHGFFVISIMFLFFCCFSVSLANLVPTYAVAANLAGKNASQCLELNSQTAIADWDINGVQALTEQVNGESNVVEEQQNSQTETTKNTDTTPLTKEEFMSRKVILGGQSIGILLQTEGASVVGFAPVMDKSGESAYPAKESGLQVGDFITEINHKPVTTDNQIGEMINQEGQNGKGVTVSVKREGQTIDLSVEPRLCADTNTWRIGLYIRDNTAGVGTMTFYEPQSGMYGALGHKVADLDDKMIDGQDKGSILSASIQDIKPGKKGEPGEKVGVFSDGEIAGTITKNSDFGIFGKMSSNVENSLYSQGFPIATVEEVKEGPATILTVVSGEVIQEYQVEISKIMPQHKNSGKGMVVKVTDPTLLDLSGGIVQGMSGSPIIQNGKLIGAVTHVFVNDPTSGFGCFAEWMVEEAVS